MSKLHCVRSLGQSQASRSILVRSETGVLDTWHLGNVAHAPDDVEFAPLEDLVSRGNV
jgi:hypothetical protein